MTVFFRKISFFFSKNATSQPHNPLSPDVKFQTKTKFKGYLSKTTNLLKMIYLPYKTPNATGENMGHFLLEVHHNIMDCGWHHQHVFPETIEEECFNYTIGLYLQDLPELFLSGPVPPDLVNDIF